MSQQESVDRMTAIMDESPDWEWDAYHDKWLHLPTGHDFRYWVFDAHPIRVPEAVMIETSVCYYGRLDGMAAAFVQALIAVADQAQATLMGVVREGEVGWWRHACPALEISLIDQVKRVYPYRLVYRPKESEE